MKKIITKKMISQTKEGLFNQQTAISSSINNNSLFQSNLTSNNNQQNQNSLFKTDKELGQTKLNDNQPNQNVLLKTDNQPKQTSLLTDNNPFFKLFVSVLFSFISFFINN